MRYLQSDQPEERFQVVLPREKGHKYSVEAPRRPLLHADQSRRQELPPGDCACIEPVAGELEGTAAAPRRRAACRAWSSFRTTWWRPRNRRRSSTSACSTSAPASGAKSIFRKASTPLALAETPEFASGTFRFSYQSMITPDSVYRLRHGDRRADASQAQGGSRL